MRFGGHQTFYIREGWLFKGLQLLIERPEDLVSDLSFDHLGVGKNMALSIQHWLQATGLAVKADKTSGVRTRLLTPTRLAELIWDRDRYFAFPDTWWILHTNILHEREHAETWYWFFNHYSADRFDRESCLRKFMRYVHNDLTGNIPKERTVAKDLSCFINTYAVDVPMRDIDPEEDINCPFRELDLLVNYRESGHIQLQRRRRNIAPNVFMHALERCLRMGEAADDPIMEGTVTDLRFFDLSRMDNNPMRVFALSTDVFFEMLIDLEREYPEMGIRVIGLAGDRQIRVVRHDPFYWIAEAFDSRSEAA